jgi:hypothetical protein
MFLYRMKFDCIQRNGGNEEPAAMAASTNAPDSSNEDSQPAVSPTGTIEIAIQNFLRIIQSKNDVFLLWD